MNNLIQLLLSMILFIRKKQRQPCQLFY